MRRNSEGTPDGTIAPRWPPLGRPRLEHARAGRRELGDVRGGACRSSGVDIHRVPILLAAVRQLHYRRHTPLRRWHGHYRDSTLVPGLRGPRDRGSFHHRRLLRRLLLCDVLALGPRGLEDEGLLLHTIGRTLLRPPAGLSSCVRSGGASRIALTGLNSSNCQGGAVHAALAGLLGVGSQSGCFGTALAGVTLLLCPSLLRRLGASSHGLP